jgi:hypothetical protein
MNNSSEFKRFLQQSFDNYEIVERDSGWSRISSRLSFQNFFKFGVRHINIYNSSFSIGLIFSIYLTVFSSTIDSKINSQDFLVTNSAGTININSHEPISAQKALANYNKKNLISFNKPTEDKENIDNEIITDNIENNNSQLDTINSDQELTSTENNTHHEKLKSKDSGVLIAEGINSSINKPRNNSFGLSRLINDLRWSFDLYTIPVYSDAMSLNGSLQNEILKQKVAAGLALKCLFKSVQFETGLVYKSQTKNFNQSILKDQTDYTYVVDTIYNYGINFLTGRKYMTSYDTTMRVESKTKTVERNIQSVNTYTTFEIPICVGYRLVKNNFASTSKLGIVTYISKRATGLTVQDNSKETELALLPNTSASWMFTISNNFSYRVRGALNVFAEPYLKFSTKENGFNELNIGQSRAMFGLKLGVEIVL